MTAPQLHVAPIVLAPDWIDDTSLQFPAEVSALIEADEAFQIYGVFDGTRRAAVRGLNDLDTLAPELAAAPLFQQDQAEGEAGPWLLSFGRGEGVQAATLRDHFCNFHGEGVGILLLTQAPEPELRSHLRGLVKVARGPDTNATVFLRYWDPVVASEFLPSLAPDPSRVARIHFTQKGTPVHVLAEENTSEMTLISVKGRANHTGVRTPFALRPEDEPVMVRIARTGLEKNLSRWLARDYVDELSPFADHPLLGPHIYREGSRFGFTRQDEFAYLGHLMVHLGGWFHQSGQVPVLTDILQSDRRAKHVPLRAAFSEAWAGSYRAVLRDVRESILADARLLADDTLTKDPDVLAACLQAHVPADRQGPFRNLWQKAQAPLGAQNAPVAEWPRIAFLSLFWGYKFYEDPFLGRRHAPQSEAEWGTLCDDFWKALIDG